MAGMGKKLKQLRIKKGLRQSEIADAAGITRAAYTNIENDKTGSITIDIGKGIAKALEIPFTELFDIETINQQKAIDKLKVLVFLSLEKYESNQLFLRQFEHNNEDVKDWERFNEYRKQLAEFKKGIYETLVNVGFCSQEDISDYYDYTHHRGKYAKTTIPPEPAKGSEI